MWLPSIPNELTPLEKAQALRLVLVDAIEQLKPGGGPTRARSPETLQHDILYEAYVEERSVANIITRHNISDTTYFRNRRAAVSAMARHLESQEEQNGR